MFKGSLKSFFVVLVCLVLGTGIGIFFQQFGVTAQLFQNFVDVKFNISEIKLLFVQFGFMFGIKINLGTIFGGIAGILLSR
ncbi:MAG: hypothetical protein KBS54_05090 [Synergistaceae bacterium]|nr:hypothetical protein [Candidatus Equadaptatus faecalis]